MFSSTILGQARSRRSSVARSFSVGLTALYYHQQLDYPPANKTHNEESSSKDNVKSDSLAETCESQVVLKRLFETVPMSMSNSVNNSMLTSSNNSTTLRNSVVIVSNVISKEECKILCNEADRLIQNGYQRDRLGSDDADDDEEEKKEQESLRRISTEDMSKTAQQLAMDIIKKRVLSKIERHFHSLIRDLGLSDWRRSGVEWEWASDEPTVNRYTSPGGTFEAHRDGYALTIVVPLNDPVEFLGGGTSFFAGKDIGDEDRTRENTVTISPPRGTAICFDGDMLHSGAPVIQGVRYVFVASFGTVEMDR
jgi:hypothetical protein